MSQSLRRLVTSCIVLGLALIFDATGNPAAGETYCGLGCYVECWDIEYASKICPGVCGGGFIGFICLDPGECAEGYFEHYCIIK